MWLGKPFNRGWVYMMVKCDLCEKDKASYICNGCGVYLCSGCRRHHECFYAATDYILNNMYRGIK